MTYFLDGGKEVSEIKEMVAGSIAEDPTFIDENKYDMTREVARERTMAKILQCVELIRAKSAAEEKPKKGQKEEKGGGRAGVPKTFEEAFYGTLAAYDESWAIRMGVHYGLFMGALNGQGSDEQRAKWGKDAQEMRLIGCFAMTELGHGSYLQGLETTATYDKKTREFVVNTPTPTATKWWIGMAGQTATMAAVYAQLIIDGTNYGVHSFLVPIRCLKSGKALPNVTVGDCGSKMGRNGLDNGWIQFHNTRIPRENMLMRWAKVTPEGVYHKPAMKQLTYNALIGTRVELFTSCSDVLKRALTVAVRYGAIRRQFPNVDKPSEEQKLLDYPTHQFRLFPIMAWAFALHMTAKVMKGKAEQMENESGQKYLDILPELHATSAGLKAFGTWYANDAIEVCRQSLGGHGYSSYSGLATMRANWAVMCSWEGDNTVMALQLGRFLMQQYKRLKEGGAPTGFCEYLSKYRSAPTQWAAKTSAECRRLDMLLLAYQHRTAVKVSEAGERFLSLLKQGRSTAQAVQTLSVDLMHCAKIHCVYYLLDCFATAISSAPKELQPVLQRLCALFGLQNMEETMTDFVESGYVSPVVARLVRDEVRQLCLEVRSEAVALVDAFNIPDFVIDSPLGRADGNIYEEYLKVVKNAPGAMGVPHYWEALIKPLTNPDN